MGTARPQTNGPVRLEQRPQIGGLHFAARPSQPRCDGHILLWPAQEIVLLDEGTEHLTIQSDTTHLQTRRLGLDGPDVIMHVGKHPLDALLNKVELVLVDRHELEREAPVGALLVLPHKPVPVQPSDEGRLILSRRIPTTVDRRHGGQFQAHARSERIHAAPFAAGPPRRLGPYQVISRGIDADAVLQSDSEHRLATIVLDRDHLRSSFAVQATIEYGQPDESAAHDVPDGDRPFRGGDQRIVRLARMRLGMLEGVRRPDDLAQLWIHVKVALRRPREPIGIVQPRVEPLGTIGGGHLIGQHVAHFVMEGGRIFRRLEIAVIFSPERPTTGQSTEHLPGVALTAEHRLAGGIHHRRSVLVHLWDPGFPEILLGQDIDRQLCPMLRHIDMV